jgi:hypothetical protein
MFCKAPAQIEHGALFCISNALLLVAMGVQREKYIIVL